MKRGDWVKATLEGKVVDRSKDGSTVRITVKDPKMKYAFWAVVPAESITCIQKEENDGDVAERSKASGC